jgi:hypothetical protein
MSKFTEGAMDTGGKPGHSDGISISKMPGGTINVGYPQDNVHGVDLPNCRGKALAGSETNLAHSLSGSSAVQRQRGATRYRE